MSEPLDLSAPIRTALIAAQPIASLLSLYEEEPAVFTRKPVPTDATYPVIVISPPISVGNVDFLTARLPTPRRDVVVYGQLGEPGVDDYRVVETIAYRVRQLFHRNKFSIDATPSYSVVEVVAVGPMPAPVDDEMLVGRLVALQFRLKDLATA